MAQPEPELDAFSADELQEIRSFLYSSYLQAAHGRPSAMPRKPKEQVDPELARLKKIRKRKSNDPSLTDEDIRELLDAANSSFGRDFADTHEKLLRTVVGAPTYPNLAGGTTRLTFGHLLLKSLFKRVCGKADLEKSGTATISAVSLGALLSALGISPLLAPVAVWFALRIRDTGLPVLCDASKEYLTQNGISVD